MKELLSLLPRPSHYIGTEEGSVHKEPASVRLHCALAFPDLYEVGMSYLGHKILYTILNNREDIFAERVYAPCRETGRLLREHGVSLATLESDTDIVKTHMFAFAITHELCFTNVLYMLELSGIPLRAADRGDDLFRWPLIVAGGGCAIASEPLAPFMDLMLLGEGEEMVPELCDLVIKAREEGWSRSRLIEEAVNIPGVYAPSLYTHDANGVLTPLKPDLPTPGRRIVADFDRAAYPEKQVVPFGAVHNRLSLEIARGCTRGCRFCQAGMMYRPVRERSADNIVDAVARGLAETGYDEVSLTSLSSTDHSQIAEILSRVNADCAGAGVRVSVPSQRLDAFGVEMAELVAGQKKGGLTFAPEAGTQRLRDVINKNVTEDDLFAAIDAAFTAGWRRCKLYFMVGLPTETDDDIKGIASLAQRAYDRAKAAVPPEQRGSVRMSVSCAVFVPKAQTPFQWDGQISPEETLRRVGLLKRSVKYKAVDVHYHDPATSFVEAVMSRGGREVADWVEAAWRRGARFDAWTELFNEEAWTGAAGELGLDPAAIAQAEFPTDYVLPWAHITAAVSPKFLARERERAAAGITTPDCTFENCSACGACPTLGVDIELQQEREGKEASPARNPYRTVAHPRQAEPPRPGRAGQREGAAGKEAIR